MTTTAAAARDQSNDMSFVSAKSSSSTDYFPDALPGSMKKTNPSLKESPAVLNDEKMDEDQVDVICKDEPENAVPPSSGMEETAQNKSEAMIASGNDNDATNIPSPKKEESSASTGEIVNGNVASPPAPAQNGEPQTFGIKDPKPSTFTGDRGGAAEDAELLAELRAISAKSSSASRFCRAKANDTGAETRTAEPVKSETVNEESASRSVETVSGSDTANLPPWKRGKTKAVDGIFTFGGGYCRGSTTATILSRNQPLESKTRSHLPLQEIEEVLQKMPNCLQSFVLYPQSRLVQIVLPRKGMMRLSRRVRQSQ